MHNWIAKSSRRRKDAAYSVAGCSAAKMLWWKYLHFENQHIHPLTVKVEESSNIASNCGSKILARFKWTTLHHCKNTSSWIVSLKHQMLVSCMYLSLLEILNLCWYLVRSEAGQLWMKIAEEVFHEDKKNQTWGGLNTWHAHFFNCTEENCGCRSFPF
jgi:hypothetical protein